MFCVFFFILLPTSRNTENPKRCNRSTSQRNEATIWNHLSQDLRTEKKSISCEMHFTCIFIYQQRHNYILSWNICRMILPYYFMPFISLVHRKSLKCTVTRIHTKTLNKCWSPKFSITPYLRICHVEFETNRRRSPTVALLVYDGIPWCQIVLSFIFIKSVVFFIRKWTNF